jgi:uncharacterized protein YjbI with pentapeptide repeats
MTALRAAEDHEHLVIDGSDALAGSDAAAVTDYSDADLEDARFDDCAFSRLQISRARFDHATFRRTTLHGCEGGNASFADSVATDVSLTSSRFVGADFSSSAMKNVVFEECNLQLASFRFARFTNVVFRNCNLTEVDFQGVKAAKVEFDHCRIQATEFSQAAFQAGSITMCEIVSLTGVKFLAGLSIDEPALLALAPALAASAGLRLQL